MRRLLVTVVVALLALAAGCGGDGDDGAEAEEKRERAEQERKRPQLPGGGRKLFPDRRVVAFYGNPRDAGLGALGVGSIKRMTAKLAKQAKAYDRRSRPVLPTFELIATVATAEPGADGLHRLHEPDRVIRRWLRAARRANALLLLDIQPGRAAFEPEVVRLAKWLQEPDVGLALDPEWHTPEGIPGQVIGSMDAREVNRTAEFLAKLVKGRDLPEKLLLVHRFTDGMISNDQALQQYPGVKTVIDADGFGPRGPKIAKYRDFAARTPKFGLGFKLFYKEDVGLMRPRSVLALKPPPDVVVYE